MKRRQTWLFLGSLLLAPLALADGGPIEARRATEAPKLDGLLDDPSWQQAPAFTDFVESFPNEGAKASLRTEARVLYTDEVLYVGVVCYDPDPSLIVRQLGRRDSQSSGDRIEVAIDSALDRRTAYSFQVNAAGGLRDVLLFGDVSSTESWDAVWDAQVATRPDGWSVELAIPLRILRFSAAEEQSFGMVVRRQVPRTHQVFDSTLIPRVANTVTPGNLAVSRFGRLTGLKQLTPRRGIEVVPYLGAKATLRPQYSDPSRPHPRLLDPSLDIGVDFKASLTSELTLTGAVNPDFGQVEADQLIQNLSNFENFFPEKRPFFQQGLDIFQSVGAEYGAQQQLFYSRRIGLDAPILGALKVSGSAREGLEIGLVDAVVMGAGDSSLHPLGYSDPDSETLEPYEARPDRRWLFHLKQPLHFGPENALPAAAPTSMNYFAAVARQRLGARNSVGALLTAVTPLAPRCRPDEFATFEEYEAARCYATGSNAVGLDTNLRDESGAWGGFAQIQAQQHVGGPTGGYLNRDGVLIKRGDVGYGGNLRAGKLGGEPWRVELSYQYQDPKQDLNQMGFQPFTNFQWVDLNVRYVRPNGLGPFHNFSVDYLLDVNWTTDGRWLGRGVNTYIGGQVQLPSYDSVGTRIGYEDPQFDTREIPYTAIAVQKNPNAFGGVFFNTDQSRRFFVNAEAFGGFGVPRFEVAGYSYVNLFASATWRPQDRVETKLDASYGTRSLGARYLETLDDDTAVFGSQDPAFFSVTLRQQLVLSPRLTAQVYAQLFSGAVRYRQFYGASLTGEDRILLSDLRGLAYEGDLNGHGSQLNLNAVLRWEYRLGSTLFLVYTRSQSEPPTAPGVTAETSVLPSRLFKGATTESVLLKWSYYWDV